jgi:GAF domain-containing protein
VPHDGRSQRQRATPGDRQSPATRELLAREAADAAIAQLGYDEMLRELLARVRDSVDTDAAAVLLLDPAGEELVARAAAGLEREDEERLRVPLGRGIAGRVARTSTPCLVEDVAAEPDAAPPFPPDRIRSVVAVPVALGERVIGVLAAGTREPRRFTPADVDTLALVAERMASVLERMRLHEAAQAELVVRHRAEARLRLLADVSRVLMDAPDSELLLDAVAALLVPSFADFWLVDLVDDAGIVRRVHVAHRDPAAASRLTSIGWAGDPRRPSGESPIAAALRGREPLWLDRLDRDDWRRRIARSDEELALLRALDPREAIIAPLIARDHTVGAITLGVTGEGRGEGRRFQRDDLELAQVLARRLALALENARLLREATEARQRA